MSENVHIINKEKENISFEENTFFIKTTIYSFFKSDIYISMAPTSYLKLTLETV